MRVFCRPILQSITQDIFCLLEIYTFITQPVRDFDKTHVFFSLFVDEWLWVPRQSAESSSNVCVYAPSYPRLCPKDREGYIDLKKSWFKWYASCKVLQARSKMHEVNFRCRFGWGIDFWTFRGSRIKVERDVQVFWISGMGYYICIRNIYIRQYIHDYVSNIHHWFIQYFHKVLINWRIYI